jgi:beta-lactamase regulating signal transducer with metallopeptidase domain
MEHNAMSFTIHSILQVVVILTLTLAATSVMKRASASTRHWVWVSATLAVALVPLTIAGFPRLRVGPLPIPVPIESFMGSQSETVAAKRMNSHGAAPIGRLAGVVVARTRVDSAASIPLFSRSDYEWLLAIVWVTGAIGIQLYTLLGVLVLHDIRRTSKLLPARYAEELRTLAAELHLRRSVQLVESDLVAGPVVSGIWRPMIILPKEANEWPRERRRVALLHELAHVKRCDCFTQLHAELVRSVYWFIPLVWLAVRRLCVERERACDDIVLSSGTKGSVYAGHLLEIAKGMSSTTRTSLIGGATLAMARRTQLEKRLVAILDPATPRLPVTYARMAAAVAVILVSAPLGALQFQQVGATGPTLIASEEWPLRADLSADSTTVKTPQARSEATAPVTKPRSVAHRAPRDVRHGAASDSDGPLLIAAAHQGQAQIVEFLLDRGTDINATNGSWNALIAAAHQGHEKLVGLLLDRGADINATNGSWSALIAAAHQGHEKVVGLLLDRGADINATNGSWNALIAAAHQGHAKVVELLLDRGAAVNATPGGQSALLAATSQGRLDVVKLLIERAAHIHKVKS